MVTSIVHKFAAPVAVTSEPRLKLPPFSPQKTPISPAKAENGSDEH